MLLARSVKSFPVGSGESVQSPAGIQYNDKADKNSLKETTNSSVPQYTWNIVWVNVLAFVVIHVIATYGIWLVLTRIMWKTFIFGYLSILTSGLGTTAGAHRLWTHRTYKAKLPLRILLMYWQTSAMQNHIFEWSRDHRVHHKFTDTDADPHNSQRGFFFSHIGWLMIKKHKDVFVKGKSVDLSDLEADPVVMFQKRYYKPFALISTLIVPVLIPWYFFGEDYWVSFVVAGVLRYAILLNGTWAVNSFAHLYGTKPYDKDINPRENKYVSVVAFGEGFHNYHHVFPWDYKTSELGNYGLNFTTAFIDFMAKIGWAYDLKTASPEIVRQRVKRTGDGNGGKDNVSGIPNGIVSHDHYDIHGKSLWGWGDPDMTDNEKNTIKMFNKLTDENK